MRGFGRTLIGVLIAVAGVALPASASGDHRVFSADFHVRATNGYKIDVWALRRLHAAQAGGVPGRGSVTVSFHRQMSRRQSEFASYRTSGTVTRRHIVAKLPGIGEIDVRPGPSLAPRAIPKRRSRFCIVSVGGTRRGFLGTIDLRGENGYARANVNRAVGFEGRGTQSCESGGGTPDLETLLETRSDSVTFYAVRLQGQDLHGTIFEADSREQRDGMAIDRGAFQHGPRSAFSFADDLTTASVGPLYPPFTGTATFTSPDQWTGDLSVSLPGRQATPLTGGDFTTTLKEIP